MRQIILGNDVNVQIIFGISKMICTFVQ